VDGSDFYRNAPWAAAISEQPPLATNSSDVGEAIADGAPVLATVRYGLPIFYATGREPARRFRVTNDPRWGHSSGNGTPIPFPPGVTPSPGSDAAFVIVIPSLGVVWEFWNADLADRTAGWIGCTALSGDGNSDCRGGAFTGSGAGLSYLAGVITAQDVQYSLAAGRIEHPLTFSSSLTSSEWVYPASKSDGAVGGTLPEGSRIQLDPALELDGLSRFDRILARTLQTYGAYCADTGGATGTFSCEACTVDGQTDVWQQLGMPDYYAPTIPWKSLRVLRPCSDT
jgi:hypothetical protein